MSMVDNKNGYTKGKKTFFEKVKDRKIEKILKTCKKINSNEKIIQYINKEFPNVEDLIVAMSNKLILNPHLERMLCNGVLEEMFKINIESTINIFSRKYSEFCQLMNNSDCLNIANIIVKSNFDIEKALKENIEEKTNCDDNNYWRIQHEEDILNSLPFFLARLQKNRTNTLVNNDRLIKLLESKDEKITNKIIEIFSSCPLRNLPKCILQNKDILKHYLNSEEKVNLISSIVSSNTYKEENENKLLEVLGGKYNSVEEVILHMYHDEGNKKREDMSIYEVLAVQLYAQKFLKENGIPTCEMDLFAYKKEDSYGDALDLKISITNDDKLNTYDLISVIHHEATHLIQTEIIEKMDFKSNIDLDVLIKDKFIADINLDSWDGYIYYKYNYNVDSIEYFADYNANLLNNKFFYNKNICYDTSKKDLEKMYSESPKTKKSYYFYSMERVTKDGTKMHLNDLVELHLDGVLKDEKLIRLMHKKMPSILWEYDINKKEMPRRRTIEELVELINCSKEPEKEIYFMLLINRFDERKEKNNEVKKNVEIVKKMLDEGKIKENQARLLLSSVRKSKSINSVSKK